MSSGGSPDPRQQPFGSGIALSGGLWIPLIFRSAGIRFLGLPVPAGHSASLAVRLLTMAPVPIGVSVFHMKEMRSGRALSLRRGGGVRSGAKLAPVRIRPAQP